VLRPWFDAHYATAVASEIDRIIVALQTRLDAGELRADIRQSSFRHWASKLSPDELRAQKDAFIEQAAGNRGEALDAAKRLLKAMKTPGPSADLAPASGDSIEAAEGQLGVSLPEDVKRVYSEVADGGFGPSEGVLPLRGIVEQTLKIRQDCAAFEIGWPAQLIIIERPGPVTHCVDSGTGEVVEWDGDAFADSIFVQGDVSIERRREIFAAGFSPVAACFADWIDRWLRGPDPAETASVQAKVEQAFADARESWRQQVEDYIDQIRNSPDERAKLGLNDEDWENELRRGLLGRPNG
jgi:hypothetical protein